MENYNQSSASTTVVVPHEQAILAILLHSATARAAKITLLQPDDFTDIRHVTLFQTIMNLFHKFNNQFDANIVLATLQATNQIKACGNVSYVAEILNLYAGDAFFDRYFAMLTTATVKRKLQLILTTCQKQLTTTTTPELLFKNLYLKLTELENSYKPNGQGFVAVAQLLSQMVQNLKQNKNHQTIYFSTGFAELDKKTNGLQPGELTILAGRPSMGKTALALNLIFNDFFINHNTTTVDAGDIIFFSLEMSTHQLGKRILTTYLDVLPDFYHGSTDNKVNALIQDLTKSNIFIDTVNDADIFRIHAKLRQWVKTRKLRLIVIDYLQLLKSVGNRRFDNRNLEISLWTRQLKEIALEFNIPVLCLSQLSRNVEKRESKRPLLSDLRDSGSIEQDADLVLFLYREEYYLKADAVAPTVKKEYNYSQPQKAEIIIAKQRNGPTGQVEILFIPHKATFMDYSE